MGAAPATNGVDRLRKYLTLAAYAATIPAANYLIGNVGTECISQGPCLIPVGFGLMAPSGVLMIGLALVLRDAMQELAGGKWAMAAIVAGSMLSLLVSPVSIAVASAVAFALAELADMAVYTPLRKRGKSLAVLASCAVGSVLDSLIFVFLAFGAIEFAAGTILAKLYASLAVSAFLHARRRA